MPEASEVSFMSSLFLKFCSVASFALAGAIVGCSGGQVLNGTSEQRAASSSLVAPDAAKGTLFVTSFNVNEVGLFPESGKNQQQTGTLNGPCCQPQGVYVTNKGVVFIGDTNDDRILVYKKGSLSYFETLSDQGQPRELAGDTDGTVYAGNVNQGTVAVYPSGASQPSTYLTVPNAADVLGVAVDGKHNLYVSFDTQMGGYGTGQIVKYPGGSGKPRNLGIKLVSASGLGFDTAGNLIACDSADSSPSQAACYVFKPGKKSPFRTLKLPNGYPIGVALNKAGTKLFVGTYSYNAVEVFNYGNFKMVDKITNGAAASPNSVAVFPPAPL
jgi:sugar lactone lactonase YvrE